MSIRETFLKTVKCGKSHKTCMVQDTVHRSSERHHPPAAVEVTHEYRCRDYSPCAECDNCQYH